MESTHTGDPTLAKGTLLDQEGERIVLGIPGTNYQLHLISDGGPTAVGKSVAGRIFARAKRVDEVSTGGRFIEPVYGRPRRVQGVVAASDRSKNTITVRGPAVFTCELMPPQKAEDFVVGQLVSFDVERGARFEHSSTGQSMSKPSMPLDPQKSTSTPGHELGDEGGMTEEHMPDGEHKTHDAGSLTDATADGISGEKKRVGETGIDD